jgi:hypothetical protein
VRKKWLIGFGLPLVLFLSVWVEQGQAQNYNAYHLQRFYYYPYYYFPHSYWPTMGPRYPERPWEPYQKPPAYMAYPPFHEPNWRYEYNEPQKYYRGFHFWLDQF